MQDEGSFSVWFTPPDRNHNEFSVLPQLRDLGVTRAGISNIQPLFQELFDLLEKIESMLAGYSPTEHVTITITSGNHAGRRRYRNDVTFDVPLSVKQLDLVFFQKRSTGEEPGTVYDDGGKTIPLRSTEANGDIDLARWDKDPAS